MINQSGALQSTTQKYLEIFDITNDLLILQDGSVSMVLQSTAINFDLYSEEEQDAAIYAYAALLNSLSFSIEIVIRSQRKDVTSYLELLKNAEIKAYNPINKKNIKEYREFVAQLVQERNVLDKKFYIVITYTALEAGLLPGTSLIPGMSKKNQAPLDKTAIIDKASTNLAPRKEHLIHQFARIGLFLRQVKTQELIQLYYTIYNPDGAKGIRVGEAVEYSSPIVNADIPPLDLVGDKIPTPPTPPLQNLAPAEPPVKETPSTPVSPTSVATPDTAQVTPVTPTVPTIPATQTVFPVPAQPTASLHEESVGLQPPVNSPAPISTVSAISSDLQPPVPPNTVNSVQATGNS